MTIYIGLNVSKGLADIQDPVVALRNMGLDRDDFALVSGLTQAGTDVNITDFHSSANLTVDQEKELYALKRSGDTTFGILSTFEDIRVPMNFNMSIDGSRLVGGSISFKYLDFSQTETVNSATVWKVKGADISTSRISSWSPIGPAGNEDSHIMYGGRVEVIGDHLVFEGLETTTPPIRKRFRAEVSTHALKIKTTNSTGVVSYRNLIAMKGIPLVFKCNFLEATFSSNIISGGRQDSSGSTIPMTWQITNKEPEIGTDTRLSWNTGDGTEEYPGSLGLGTYATPGAYKFTGTTSKQRIVEFFYDPAYIESLGLPYSGLTEWTNVTLPNIKKINLEGNDINLMPEFRSDADLDLVGVDGGAGLAPNLVEIVMTGNNLTNSKLLLRGRSSEFLGLTEAAGNLFTDAEDDAWSTNAATANAQLNRLPLTIENIFVNGCFQDDTTINLSDHKSLKKLIMVADYQADLSRRQPRQALSPIVHNPEVTSGAKELSSVANGVSSMNLFLHWKYDRVAMAFYNGLYGGANAPNGTQAYVKVQYRNKLSSPYTRGTISSGFTDGEVIIFEKSSTTSANAVFSQMKTTGGALKYADAANAVGAYSFTKCDSSGNIVYDDSSSIEDYNIHEQLYSGLDRGVINGIRTRSVDVRFNSLLTNSMYRAFDPNNTAESSADAAIGRFRSNNLQYFYSESNQHDVVDMSGKTSLLTYWHRRGVCDSRFSEAERTIDGKLDGCTNLRYLNMYHQRRTAGDLKTNGALQNKSKLWWVDFRWGWGATGAYRDDLLTGSDNVMYMLTAGSAWGAYTNDFFATQNSDSLHRGKVFANQTRLRYIYAYYHSKSSARFDNPDNSDYSLDLSSSNQLYGMYMPRNNIRGAVPNLSSITTLRWTDLREQRAQQTIRHIQADVKYTVKQIYGSNNVHRASAAQWAQIGWNGGGTPSVGSVFTANFIDPTATTLDSGKQYQIRHLGTMPQGSSGWQAIGAGSSAYVGQVFTSNGANPSGLSGLTGKSQVMPWTLDKVESFGLEGQVPTLTNPYLYWLRLNNNTLTGQFPTFDCPRLHTLWLNANKFSGNIPDFSSCPRMRIVRLQRNELEGYIPGSLSTNYSLNKLNLDNNKLRAGIATDFIADLYDNYINKPRGGVSISAIGQSPTSGSGFSESAVNNDGTEGDLSSANKLAFLRQNGWTVTLDT